MYSNQNPTCMFGFVNLRTMAKKKSKNDDGALMEFLLNIVENIIAPKSVRKIAQKKIDKLTEQKFQT